MVHGFIGLCTAAYVLIDDPYRARLGPLDAGPAPVRGYPAGGAATARSSR